jgi:hypothetical protein
LRSAGTVLKNTPARQSGSAHLTSRMALTPFGRHQAVQVMGST